MSMSWSSIGTSLQALGAHSLLLAFSILLLFKLDHTFHCSWWIIFLPLWLFHAVVARGRFSLPAPSVPHDRHWAPFHAVVGTPLLIAFEILLCIYLENTFITGSANLKVVFLPLLTFEVAIFIDNFRMCKALLPGGNESMSDEAVWEALPHFFVAISMVFFFAATGFTLLKLSGGIDGLGWWDLFIYFGIAQFFSFLLCTKWYNPIIHATSNSQEATSSSSTIAYLGHSSGLVVSSEDPSESDVGCCFLPEIGGHIMKIPVIAFQLLLCMRLEGTPPSAKHMPLGVVFSPLLLLQGVGVLFSASRFTEKIVPFLRSGADGGTSFTMSSTVYDLCEFLHRGSRFLGWWSIDEASREELARLYSSGSSRYKTFCKYPPEIVKKMPKRDLAEEVFRLQAALGEQNEIMKFSQQEYERLQNEKVLCRICFEGEISIVLLPCRHRILCSTCSARCKKCPICRVHVEERLTVYDV